MIGIKPAGGMRALEHAVYLVVLYETLGREWTRPISSASAPPPP